MNLIVQTTQLLLLLSIIALAYRMVTVIIDARTSRKFVLKKYFQEEIRQELETNEKITFSEKITSFKKYRAYLASELKAAKMDVDINQFILRRILLAIAFTLLGVILYAAIGVKLYLYLAIPLGILAYKIPKKNIQKNKLYYEQQMKIELPEYLSAFAVLLQSHTPFEATKRSKDYAGPLLQPYVEELITEIELYPASYIPYENFANAIEIRQAKEFMVALNQIMKVDAKSADRIIQDQIRIMDEIQQEAYNEQIEARPDEVQTFITPMLIPLVAIMLTFLFVLISDSFSQI